MFQNPHIVPSSTGTGSTIRMGRRVGVAGGMWWGIFGARATDGCNVTLIILMEVYGLVLMVSVIKDTIV